MNIKNRYNYTFNVAWQVEPVNDYVYVYSYKSNHFINLSDVSKEIWMQIGEGKSIEEISQQISQEYEMNLSIVQNDVMELVSCLLKEDAIECMKGKDYDFA